jgi:hypothetical protein
MAEVVPTRPDEYLDELHWVFSYHVGHLGVMAAEMDRLYLPQAARDFRQSVATWDKLLSDIEEARGTAGARNVARGPVSSRSRPSPAAAPGLAHLARQRREAARGHERSP